MNHTHQAIVQAIFDEGGYVFGGFVRDLIAGDEPSDIDCANVDVNGLIMRLIEGVGKVEVVAMKDLAESPYWTSLEARLMVNGVQVDISRRPFHSPDFDVNMLTLSKSRIGLGSDCKLDLLVVLGNIRNKTAFALGNRVDKRRFNHMKDKGWLAVDTEMPYTAPSGSHLG